MFCKFQVVVLFLSFASGGAAPWCAGISASPLPQDQAGESSIDFSLQIEPILSDRCYQCHGPDEGQRKADLRLDLEDDAKEYAIVPGDAESSELFARITTHDDEKMPPPDSNLTLQPGEIELIRRWIDEGAVWKKHWAFEPPRIVSPRESEQSRSWARNEIDHFVFDLMKKHGLEPNTQATPETLVRRLYFDITGLPPTLAEIDALVADWSPRTYEKLVDDLLSSSAYGERMAADWLDVARYSDTYGYQVDRERFVWPWRDWVVRSFNQNLPYDRFLTLQIAGDLLPAATDDQILATTFNRLHPQKVEGGSVPEEFRVEYVADRTQTFGTAFLGLTLECARCHDHKFDPISQREYYQLFSYFNNIDEAGLYSFFTHSVPTPTLMLQDAAAERALAKLSREIETEEKQLQALLQQKMAALPADLPGEEQRITQLGKLPGQIAIAPFEQSHVGGNQILQGDRQPVVRLTGDDEVKLKVGNFRRFQPFTVSLRVKTPDVKDRAVVFHRSRAWTDAGSRGYQLLIEDGRLSWSLIHFWPGNAISIQADSPLPVQQWTHVCVTYDGSSRASGLAIYVNGRRVAATAIRDQLTKQITGGGQDHIAIGARFRDRGFTGGEVTDFKVFARQLTDLEVAIDSLQKPVDAARASLGNRLAQVLIPETGGQESGGQESADWAALLRHGHLVTSNHVIQTDRDYAAQLETLQKTRQAKCQLLDQVQEIMVMREMAHPRPAFVLGRGHYAQRQQPVHGDVPALFDGLPKPSRNNRLGLARWMVHPDHPLTARVAVNRLWQMLMGQGLVRTPEDFGSQGQRPEHKDLLDWMARDFVGNAWDIKRMIKKIVMSATYQQSADADSLKQRIDPQNIWLSRSNRFRLPAEMIRDNALATSGLLIRRLGGAPVKPYDLSESFKPIKPDEGDALYRRSLYTYWKRTGPAPMMMTFDASKRDVCRVRRERTLSPLQALTLLNGPQFVEAARSLAQRQILEHADHDRAIIADMFRLLTGRAPNDREMAILTRLLNQQLRFFGDDPSATKAYLAIGQTKVEENVEPPRLAALAVVANTIMNFDQALIRP